MKIYDLSDDICEAYVFGPILGAWQSFHRFIADRIFGERPYRWLTEPEKKLHDAFVVASGTRNIDFYPKNEIPSEPIK